MGAVKKVSAVGGIAAVAVIIGVAVGTSGNKTPVTVQPVVATSAPASQVAAPLASPPDTPAAPTTQAAPAMTDAQQQAVTAAQGYLSDGQGFSRQGLLQQLTSSYGSGFGKSDAVFAVGYLHPDWDAQAVVAAKGYLSDGQGFSSAGLYQQLTSSYGSGFTGAEASYALKQVGM